MVPDRRLWRRLLQKLIGLVLLSLVGAAVWLWPAYAYLAASTVPFSVKRLPGNPIVHAGLRDRVQALSDSDAFENINGPSLLRVPDWVEAPLGKYYLYFAHHKGSAIRLAYADELTGPWQIHEPGTLQLEASGFPSILPSPPQPAKPLAYLWRNFSLFIVRDYLILNHRASVTDPKIRKARGWPDAQSRKAHIASPDVVIDRVDLRILMYYHGMSASGMQLSRIAESTDGLTFRPLQEIIPSTYLRAFRYRDEHFLLGMPGVLYRSKRIDGGFEPRRRLLFEPDMRHAGLWVDESTLYVFWTRVGDAPERILLSTVDLKKDDWNEWQATEPVEIMRPELTWEGAELPNVTSLRGEMSQASNELRDPYFFEDADGARYLLYTGAGEQAIGIALLDFEP